MLKAGKLSHLIKELKQNNEKDKAKAAKKGETSEKGKPSAILMEEDGTEGPMIIEAEIRGHFVHRMYVDEGSSSEILADIATCKDRQRGTLNIRMDELHGCKVTISTQRNHKKARSGTVTLRSSMIIPLECTMVSGPRVHQPVINQVTKEKIQVAIHPEYPEQTIPIGSTLTEEGRKELCGLLKRNLDIFAWKQADMTGVLHHLAKHRLNIREGCLPVRQKNRGKTPEKNKAIYEEVEKLVDAGIMKEVHYHSWLSNLVMVKKHDGSWRMCVDFKDLHKACPKDGYPLPEIDWKIESLLDYRSGNGIQTNENIDSGATCVNRTKGKKELIIYLAAAKEAVGAVLMTERDGKQMPIYFVSRALQGPKINYTPMKKLILDLTKNISQWIDSSRFHVERLNDDPHDTPIEDKEELSDPWILFTDGSSCRDGSGAGLIITNLKGARHDKILGEDALSKMASTSFAYLSKQVLVKELKEKSIDEKEVLALVEEEGRTWMTPIHEYLVEEILPEEKKKKARVVRRKARRYAMTNGFLYKKSFLGPWLYCLGPLEANYVLREIHEGSCSMHVGPWSVVEKALRSGYYWPTMHADAKRLIRECNDYQIIFENEKKFRDNPFKDWCKKLCIRQCFAFIKHPQSNRLVERANKSLGKGIKAQLEKRSKNWIKEISHVLWAHRTMIKSSNRETPFLLTYGIEAMIPVDIGKPTLRTTKVDMIKNDEALEINLDLLEEKREHAAIQEARSKVMMEKYYNARVRNTSFKPGDLVYRSNEASHAEDGGKLGPMWEGPYKVTKALEKGAYKLRDRK
uniref:Reverse transcriptase domain-containing protein n=1 Tax=Tanacetum cinerariifolium TaxID=118510 RepID=A0A6L2L6G5_TANCI|nr:hypothetical protein [Tanacetum cinerariifolium]